MESPVPHPRSVAALGEGFMALKDRTGHDMTGGEGYEVRDTGRAGGCSNKIESYSLIDGRQLHGGACVPTC